MNDKPVLRAIMLALIILQSFYLGWYAGKNHERLEWSMRDIIQQGDIERERARNEVLADLVGP